MKFLGVYLGNQDFEQQNWEGVVAKVCARLSKWRWLLPRLSYRGRVLVVNNLVASTLWHRLKVLSPPRSLVDDIQKQLIDFFWTEQHWIQAAALYLPVEEGGQGLVDIRSKIMSFRLQTAQRLLYQCGLRWQETAEQLLRRVSHLGYSIQLFLLRRGEVDLTGLTPFYTSVLEAWQGLEHTRDSGASPGMWLLEEPLLYNSFITPQILSSSLRLALQKAGCVKVGHLLVVQDPGQTGEGGPCILAGTHEGLC